MSVVNAIPLIAAGDDGYSISRSLRFRSSASAYFNRTYATPTNNQKGTVSLWVKLGSIPSSNIMTIYGGVDAGGNGPYLQISLNALRFVDNSSDLITTNLFRDYAAWYHFVAVIDTTQATAANRVKLYVNGVQITAFSSATYGAQNYNSSMLSSGTQYIGYSNTANNRFADCYLAEVNFIDGQALTPSSFGEYNLYGQWVPKKYAGSYGTNGFYLNFNDNSAATATTIGKDSSGLGNNWTPNNISVTAGSTYDSMKDVPTLTSATAANFATWNPITGGSSTCSDGNLAAVFAPINGARVSSIAVTDGKWYAEFVFTLINGYGVIGIGAPYLKGWTTSQESNANCVVKYSHTSGGTAVGSWTMPTSSLAFTIAINDVIGVALDMTTSTVTFYKNGTNVGNFTFTTGGSAVSFLMGNSDGSSNGAGYANFGQRPFAYTPPTGFVALNTFNL